MEQTTQKFIIVEDGSKKRRPYRVAILKVVQWANYEPQYFILEEWYASPAEAGRKIDSLIEFDRQLKEQVNA